MTPANGIKLLSTSLHAALPSFAKTKGAAFQNSEKTNFFLCIGQLLQPLTFTKQEPLSKTATITKHFFQNVAKKVLAKTGEL